MKAPLSPADRTKREHVGTVKDIKFREEESGFTIAVLGDGRAVKGVSEDPLEIDVCYRFLGRWQSDPRWGPQFKFDTCLHHLTASRKGTEKYLERYASRVGPATAAKLWNAYGGDAVKVLRESPFRVVEAGIMKEADAATASRDLIEASKFEATTIDLFELFAGRGFPGSLVDSVIERWGAAAPEIIRRNPFRLLTEGLPGCGFKRTDKLYLELGKPEAALKRQALAAWNHANSDRDGHTWYHAEKIAEAIQKAIGVGARPKDAIKLAIRAGLFQKRKNCENVWLADWKRADAEQRIAANIKRLIKSPPAWPDSLPEGHPLSDHQVEKLKIATSQCVGILAGSPGTGKTFTLAQLLREIIAEYGSSAMRVCAPTGKAAVRATQSLRSAGVEGVTAKTIHTTLGITRNGHDGAGWGFERNAENPLDEQFIVVDETSMIDTDLAADLLDACQDGSQVLWIGDPYQLPPVGHGAPLRDLIAANVPCGELREVRRNAGMIVHSCLRIKNGESFDTCKKYDPDNGANLRLIDTADEHEAAKALERVLTGMRKFDPVWQTQVIVATNQKSILSRHECNKRLHHLLNPDGYTIPNHPFKIGDKIICLKNSWMQTVEPIGRPSKPQCYDARNYRGDGEEIYVANGEIGVVEAISPGLAVARFSAADEAIKIPLGKAKPENGEESGQGSNFDLAYAITCHKAQGSEAPCVIVLIDQGAGAIASREWVYTAISRARDLCILIGSREVLDKQARRQTLVRRKTFLCELVNEALAQELASEEAA